MLCMLGLLPWPLLCASCLLLIRLALGCSWHTSICWLGSPLLCHLMLASLKDVCIRSPRGASHFTCHDLQDNNLTWS